MFDPDLDCTRRFVVHGNGWYVFEKVGDEEWHIAKRLSHSGEMLTSNQYDLLELIKREYCSRVEQEKEEVA